MHVSVVVPTKDRPDCLPVLLDSLLANQPRPLEIIVVDQSAGDATAGVVERYFDFPEFRYIRSSARGSANGRNSGIAAARGEIIALTDDDCEVPPNWIGEIRAAFAQDASIGVIFGTTAPGPYDPSEGFIPMYLLTEPYLARGMHEKHRVEGISACMALKRSVWQSIGGFDGMLGNGTPLRSGAEGDFTIRALQAGYSVYETPRVHLVHYGFRTWEQGRKLVQGYWFGTDAMLGKHLKCDFAETARYLLHLAWRFVFARSGVAASLGRSSQKWLRLASFLHGMGTGLITRTDRRRRLFAGPAFPEEFREITRAQAEQSQAQQ